MYICIYIFIHFYLFYSSELFLKSAFLERCNILKCFLAYRLTGPGFPVDFTMTSYNFSKSFQLFHWTFSNSSGIFIDILKRGLQIFFSWNARWDFWKFSLSFIALLFVRKEDVFYMNYDVYSWFFYKKGNGCRNSLEINFLQKKPVPPPKLRILDIQGNSV